jgi:hypothetical protein
MAQVVTSENRAEQINGNDYYEVATAYFKNTMYEDELQAVDDLFGQTRAVFNATPKVVNIATALSVGGDLVAKYEEEEFANEVISNLSLNQEKLEIATLLLLGKSVLLEVQNNENIEEYIETGYDMQDFPYTLAYYPADQYELVKEGNEILWAKISGVKLIMNDEGDGYEEVEITKIYMRDEEGNAFSYVLDQDDNKTDEVEYEGGVLPIHEVVTKYDLKQLFYSIDRINEYEAFIRNILFLAGEPILMGAGVDRLAQQDVATMSDDRYNKLKALFTRNETAKMQMIEITGASAKIMMEKQTALTQSIIKDYPEYSISEVLEGGNVGDTVTRIRLTEVLSRIQEIRRVMEEGMNAIISIVGYYEGKEFTTKFVEFKSMLDNDTASMLELCAVAKDAGLISKRSAMYNIRELFISEDVDEELSQIETEINEAMAMGENTETDQSLTPTTGTPAAPDDNQKNMDKEPQPAPVG